MTGRTPRSQRPGDPLRVLHVLDHSVPLHSGYSFRTLAILRHQQALGLETRQVTSSKHTGARSAEEVVEGQRFHRTVPSRPALARWPLIGQLEVIRDLRRRVAQLAAHERPDVVHAHSPALNGAAVLLANRRLRLPVVYEMRASWEDAAVDHGTMRRGSLRYVLSRALETAVLRRASAITTISEGLRRDIVVRGIADRDVTVVPNAVDVARFRHDQPVDPVLRERWGLEGKTVIGFIGSFYAYEGLSLLIDAVPSVRRDVPDLRVLLVGSGREEAALRRRVREAGLEDCVVFTGSVPHDEIATYYRLVDLLVYPRMSIRLTELVTPLKPLEAMAMARLVVASDVGGHRELIRHGDTGLLFRAGDAPALAATVAQLLRAPERWPVMRARGREFVERERSWAKVVQRYAPLYAHLVANTAPARRTVAHDLPSSHGNWRES